MDNPTLLAFPDGVALVPVVAADMDFLARLYASTRQEELAAVNWDADQKNQFLLSQFLAQHVHYQRTFPQASFDVILLGGEPIGRLYVDRRPDEHRIVDIALLPCFRGRGIGGHILKALLDEADAANKPVRIHVEKNNPALRLYERLGFEIVEDRAVYWFLERTER